MAVLRDALAPPLRHAIENKLYSKNKVGRSRNWHTVLQITKRTDTCCNILQKVSGSFFDLKIGDYFYKIFCRDFKIPFYLTFLAALFGQSCELTV
ncbi:MAG: hypothetical protein A2979_10820 [Deltaproteobacteria bacterium RIFCSPLOWO2_01_FULL_45_74]|nr:MAG: hypothetical protein A3D22_06555 [Deltaproteobacteria bacterium RIFCSPHIGHO2_02_FULL_44_53]OGQ32441.1 MAG: hypothetical protein A2979_10820 [Deltaproteobacteria bacterium RIFCSPLOWO2_01_FULL_45_74]OGQ41566.1 MAG: hypothetical protein A3I70_05165 [Deltaproteobacteria bacterium RIFCSPLOWO2_02_FULL_44_34]